MKDRIDIKGFHEYLNMFYGSKGVYPIREVTQSETFAAIDHIIKSGQEFEGDTIDREAAANFIFNEEELNKGYGTK